jgi:hypothetical protein
MLCPVRRTLTSRPVLAADPLDVLVIDEAGQLALIDAVVASMSARNVVMLGDPQQLPQVAQANHPGRAGDSALGHETGPLRNSRARVRSWTPNVLATTSSEALRVRR